MKRIITLLSMTLFSFGQISFGQIPAIADIATTFDIIPSASLPYYATKTDRRQEPICSRGFPSSLWGNSFNVSVWQDLGLTIPLVYNNDEDMQVFCSIYRRFTPSNGNYYLGAIEISPGDNWKIMLVTATNTGVYIDALEVNVSGYYSQGSQYWDFHVKQWKIDANMQVTVYRLKPTSSTPIMFDENPTILSTIHAQRIDEIYQINSSGQFIKTGEILYQPKNYPLSVFYDTSVNIWEGNEVPL